MKKCTKSYVICNTNGDVVERLDTVNDYLGPEVLMFTNENLQLSEERQALEYVSNLHHAKLNLYNAIQEIISLSNKQKDELNDYSKKKIKSTFCKMKGFLDKITPFPNEFYIICLMHDDIAEVKNDISELEKQVIYKNARENTYIAYHQKVISRLFSGYYNGWTFSPADWAKTKKFKSFIKKQLGSFGQIKVLPNDRLFELSGETYYKFSISIDVPVEIRTSEFDNETFQRVFSISKKYDISAIKEKDNTSKSTICIEFVTKFNNEKVR